MWTTKIKSIDKMHGRVRIIVTFSNGTESFDEEYSSTYSISMEWLKEQLRNRISNIEGMYAFAETLAVNQTIDLSESIPPQTDLDRETFLNDHTTLRKMQYAIETGFKKETDQDFIDLTEKVKGEYKPEYVEFL